MPRSRIAGLALENTSSLVSPSTPPGSCNHGNHPSGSFHLSWALRQVFFRQVSSRRYTRRCIRGRIDSNCSSCGGLGDSCYQRRARLRAPFLAPQTSPVVRSLCLTSTTVAPSHFLARFVDSNLATTGGRPTSKLLKPPVLIGSLELPFMMEMDVIIPR